MPRLQPGDPAPDFQLTDAAGQPCRLADFAPGPLILYFYPAALTPGCTIEAVDFTAAAPELLAAGYRIVGVSPDAPAKLARFTEKKELTVTLLSDPTHATLEAYGAWGVKVLYGKEVTGVIRSTFVLDLAADGQATVRLAQYGVKATGHVARLRRDLGV